VKQARAIHNNMRDHFQPKTILHTLLARNKCAFHSLTLPKPDGFNASPDEQQTLRKDGRYNMR